jgi:hypothetical protein
MMKVLRNMDARPRRRQNVQGFLVGASRWQYVYLLLFTCRCGVGRSLIWSPDAPLRTVLLPYLNDGRRNHCERCKTALRDYQLRYARRVRSSRLANYFRAERRACDKAVWRGWSKPYKKSGSTKYRSRIVRVPYPPGPKG